MPRQRTPSLPQGRWRPKRKAGSGRSRARISESGCEAGFHETPMATPNGLPASLESPPNRRRPRESPRGRAGRGTGKGFTLQPRPEKGFFEEASASEGRSWKAARPSGGAAIRKGISEGFGPERFPGRREASAQRLSEGRPERFRPRCEPSGKGAASAGPNPKREATAGFRSRPSDPTGIGEGVHASWPGPTGCRTGLHRLAPVSGGKRSGRSTPASRSKAAQREMASPPSDGSQSWDKWGPVATPALIMIPADSPPFQGGETGPLIRLAIMS